MASSLSAVSPSSLWNRQDVDLRLNQLEPIIQALPQITMEQVTHVMETLHAIDVWIGEHTHDNPIAALRVQVADMAHAVSQASPLPYYGGDPYAEYELGRTLRETIYGSVRLGRRRRDRRMVAIKLSNRRSMQQGTCLEDPEQEIKVMWRVSRPTHRNVVELLDVFRCDRFHWSVLEFCPGGEFFGAIQNKGKFDNGTARRYFRQLMAGVRHIHACGFCHRDLSLENILLDADANLKICDFGMAAVLSPGNGGMFPGDPTRRPGKIGYMAPEIFAGRSYSGRAADVYSCGVMLFIMLTATPPYSVPHEAQDARFQYIQSGRMSALLQRWSLLHLLDERAVDLCQRMMLPEAHRLTMDEIDHHAWVLDPSA